MTGEKIDAYQKILERIAEEEKVREKIDKNGSRWTKVYFGSGAHFQNWLNQVIELKGKANVEIEVTDSTGLQCYEKSGQKAYRIWIKDTDDVKN